MATFPHAGDDDTPVGAEHKVAGGGKTVIQAVFQGLYGSGFNVQYPPAYADVVMTHSTLLWSGLIIHC
jgi:hypothetical protein